MRRVLFWLTDRSAVKQTMLRPVEWISRQGHFATSLFRPLDVSDWDYANEECREWKNPFDTAYVSRDSFYDLYELAAEEAADMIREFRQALPRESPCWRLLRTGDFPAICREFTPLTREERRKNSETDRQL